MKENNRPLIIALRLKVVDGEITEIEHVLARNMRPDRMQNLMTPRAAFLADVPPGERTSREDMINAANSYFESIEHGDGKSLLSPRIASGTKMAAKPGTTPRPCLGRFRWARPKTTTPWRYSAR
jgi:hypothetical protein